MPSEYIDCCPGCPHDTIVKDGHRYRGPANPGKCRFCKREPDLKSQVWGYVEAEQAKDKLVREIRHKQLGLKFYEDKMEKYQESVGELLEKDFVVLKEYDTALVVEKTLDGVKIRATKMEK